MNASKAKGLIFLAALAASGRAQATMDFPAQIEQHLMLPAGAVSMIAPPDGCHLCHVSGNGGSLPLTRFGTLMEASGTVKGENGTIASALDMVASNDPAFITDLKTGKDPNLDTTVPNTDLVPHYGCGSIAPGAPHLSARETGVFLVIAVGALFAGRGRRRGLGPGK